MTCDKATTYIPRINPEYQYCKETDCDKGMRYGHGRICKIKVNDDET